ncbi:DUF6777 domain-containing protein [Streptomyces sp. 2A115]|uniref:DUF6777 domain-containing protein n=1 Tax=Streptomyces sp. 2A115 TaxID=3457439 RepID=UPI003FD5B7B7
MLILSGCSEQRLFTVKAVAAGVSSLAPFFEEDGSLGEDSKVTSQQPHSGLQQGNSPGLYGGTSKPTVCDVDRLKDFLTDPDNRQKAREWARVVGITPDRIEEYIDGLTPVLLRHDTLVKNHDYKKSKAVPFDALLEAGIAVLVNDQGLPAVKCSCGNPLRSFDKDPEKISVKFEDGNKEWDGYEKSSVVAVKPSPQPLERIALVDVDNPDRGINRPVGSEGESDTTFDATEQHAVPSVAGMTFNQASQRLSELGLAVAYSGSGDELPTGDASVTGSDPGPGTKLRFGDAVALSLGEGTESGSGSGSGSGGGSTDPSPSDEESTPGGGTPSETETTPGGGTPTETETTPGGSTPTETETTPGGGTPTETDSTPTESPTPSDSTPTATPTATATATSTPTSPPSTTRPTSVKPTPAEPTPVDPTSVEPPTSEPASSEPVSSEPVSSSEPATGDPAQSPA